MDLAEQYRVHGYDDGTGTDEILGNVTEDGWIIDYASSQPFIEDEFGGVVPQRVIDTILEDAKRERNKLPPRYRMLEPEIDDKIDQLIDELTQSSRLGRFVDSGISFPQSRRSVRRSDIWRDRDDR